MVAYHNFGPDYTIQWYYNEGHHGKDPTGSAKDFAEYANKIVNGMSCLYLAENEIMAEPQNIETSPKIPRTLKVQRKNIKSFKNL